MPGILIYGDTERSATLRHEVPIAIIDPFLYLERPDGSRLVTASVLEADRIAAAAPDIELITLDSLGRDELISEGKSWRDVEWETSVRAVEKAGLTDVVVPDEFPTHLADRLREKGVKIVTDDQEFVLRRRAKSAAELAGVRRAQVAANAAMAAVAAIMRDATPSGGAGSPLRTPGGDAVTSEMLRERLREVCARHNAQCPADVIVASGKDSGAGHEPGSGPVHDGEPLVVDLWPQDEQSGCWADMTRTFVVGEITDFVAEAHRLSLEALRASTELARPGAFARDLYAASCEVFERAGHPTQRTKPPGVVLNHGFYFSLGHGVGLEVHEEPSLGRTAGQTTLVAGDVLALEPGTFAEDNGFGARLEDLVLVTEDGHEVLTDYPYDLRP